MIPIDRLLSVEKRIQRELKWKMLFETAEKANLDGRNSGEVGVENIDRLVLNRSSLPKHKSINKRNISFSTGTRIKKLHRSNIKRSKDTKRLCLKKFILDDLEKSIIEHDVYFTFNDLEHTIENKGNISDTKSLEQVTRYIEGFPYRLNINYTYPQFKCNMKLANSYGNSDKVLKRGNDEEPQKKKRRRKIISELIANLTQNLNNSKVNYTNCSDYLDICTNTFDNLEIDGKSINPKSTGNNLYSHDVYHLSLNKMYCPETRNIKKHSPDTTHTDALSETTTDKNLYHSGMTVDIGNRACELNSVSKNQMKVIRNPSSVMIQNLGNHKDAISADSRTLDQNKPLKTMMNEDGGTVSSNCKGVSVDPNKIINEGIVPVNYRKNPFLDTDEVPATLGSAETATNGNEVAKISDLDKTPVTPTTKSKKRKAIFSKEITSSSNDSSPHEIIAESRSAKNVIEEDEADTILDYNDATLNSNKVTLTAEASSKNKRRNVKTEVVTILDCRNESLDSNKTSRTPRAKAKNGVKAVRINQKDRISSSCEENLLFASNKTRTGLRSGTAAMKGDKVTITSDCKDESLDSNPAPITAVKKYKSKKIINSSKEMLSSNCKQNHLVDSNQSPACIKGAKTIIKEDEATTALDYKDEVLDPNSARIKPTKNFKNAKAVRNSSKEIISLKCKGNEFLDSNEMRPGSGGRNKLQMKEDKVPTESDDKDEFLDSNSSPKKSTKKSKTTKTVKNSSKKILSLKCKENQFVDSNEIRAASGGANKRQIKEDKVTTDSDDKEELLDSNSSPKKSTKKSKNTKTVKNSSKEILSLNCKGNEFLDSNEMRPGSGGTNKLQMKEDKVTADSDDKDELLDSNSSPKKPTKKSKNTKTVKNSSKEILSLNCKDDQFLDSNENRSASGKPNITIKVDKVTTVSDDKNEVLDSNSAPVKPTKKSKNVKTVKNSKEIISSNREENHFLDPNKILVTLTNAKAVTRGKKAAATSDYNHNENVVTPRAKSKTRNAGRASTENDVIFPNCKPNHLDSDELPAILTRAKTAVNVDEIATTLNDKNGNLDLNKNAGKRSVKSKNVKAGRTSKKDPISSNLEENHFLVANKSSATASSVKTVTKDQTSTTSYSDAAVDSNKTRVASTTKLKSMEVRNLTSNEMKLSNGKINSSSNNNGTSHLQGTMQTINSHSARNKTKDLIESFVRDVSFKEVNFASNTYNTDHQMCLSRSDEKYISRYLKESNDSCEYENLLRIVNFVEQRSPQITNYILAMRVLEVLGRSKSDRYGSLGNGVKEGILTISKFLGRGCFETYLAYALWLYERKRKT